MLAERLRITADQAEANRCVAAAAAPGPGHGLPKKYSSALVVLGQSGCGKSIITCCLIEELGGGEIGVLDEFKQDINSSANFLWNFKSNLTNFTVIDPPGRLDSIKNVLTGIFLANTALLVIDATTEFNTSKNQLDDHCLLAYALGVNRIICCFNKMDATSPEYSEDRYIELKGEVLTHLNRVGYHTRNTMFVPISALNGENFTQRSPNLHWYTGPTLVDACARLFTCTLGIP
ncbi:elongation factor 1-alpha-like [Bidens hawaiensis]|uniref:elongation factor 1-alpha-like n=1 Tax=Bidens hawaiensis TaxID=980011 RepID=UPI00404B680F